MALETTQNIIRWGGGLTAVEEVLVLGLVVPGVPVVVLAVLAGLHNEDVLAIA